MTFYHRGSRHKRLQCRSGLAVVVLADDPDHITFALDRLRGLRLSRLGGLMPRSGTRLAHYASVPEFPFSLFVDNSCTTMTAEARVAGGAATGNGAFAFDVERGERRGDVSGYA